MEEDTTHVEIMAVTALLALRLGLSMVVALVNVLVVVRNLYRTIVLIGVVRRAITVA
jgi:hypothetical protein